MATETQSFAGAWQNPWTDIPAGWTVVNGAFSRWPYGSGEINGKSFGQLIFDTYSPALRTISAPMRWNSVGSSSEWGFCAINAARTGFSLIVKNASTTLRKEVAGSVGATIATLSTTNTADATFSMDFNDTTGAITVKKNGSTVLTGTYTDTPSLKLGLQSYNSGTAQSFGSVTIDYTPAYTVTSINGGVPITASQATVSAVTTGFTGLPASITATYSGGSLAITGITGTTNAPTFTKPVRVDGQPFPKDNTSVLFTFINGSETASGSETITKDATEVVLTVSGGITNDPATWTYWLTQDGFTAEGGELAYIPYGDLVLTADGGGSATDAGTFTSWFRPATGTGAGNVYAYTWVITEAGISPAGSGLTSSGLTSSGLTRVGLTSTGL